MCVRKKGIFLLLLLTISFAQPSAKYGDGIYVAWTIPEQDRVYFGRIELVDIDDESQSVRYVVEFEPESWKSDIEEEDIVQLPNKLVDDAKKSIEDEEGKIAQALITSGTTVLLTAGSPWIVTFASAAGTGGAAATTSGLWTLGAGSTLGGVIVISAAPAVLGALAMRKIAAAINDDPATVNWATIGGVVGGFMGTGAALSVVGAAGMGGLTGAGITNGLAVLGLGAKAAGGYGMLGGIAAVSSIALGGVAVVGGATYLIADHYRQKEISEEFKNRIEKWSNDKQQRYKESIYNEISIFELVQSQ